ncbi:unnamed protein product, partial [marine sediment metagenome]
PISTITGADATAEALVSKVKEEATLIRRLVPNVESLDVTIERSSRFDGV